MFKSSRSAQKALDWLLILATFEGGGVKDGIPKYLDLKRLIFSLPALS